MDIRKVKKLIELLEESGIAEIEIKEGEEAVRISRMPTGGVVTHVQPMVHAAPPAAAATPAAPVTAIAAGAPAAPRPAPPARRRSAARAASAGPKRTPPPSAGPRVRLTVPMRPRIDLSKAPTEPPRGCQANSPCGPEPRL